MNLKDLYTLNSRVISIIQEHNPTEQLNTLTSYLTSMRTSPTPELVESINTVTADIDLKNEQITAELELLPHIEYLDEHTELFDGVGVSSSNLLREIRAQDPYTAVERIPEITTRIANTLAFLADSNNQLSKLGATNTESDEGYVLSFIFGGDAMVQTTQQLTYRSKQIEDILLAFARLVGDKKAFQTPVIQSISKSSPTSIDIVLATVQAYNAELHIWMVMKGITWLLQNIERGQNIILNQRELSEKGMTNPKIDDGFHDLIQVIDSEDALDLFVRTELMEDPRANITDGAGAEEENVKALKRGMKKLRAILEKGGTVKGYIPKSVSVSEEVSEPDLESRDLILQQQAELRKTIELQDARIKMLESGEVGSTTVDTYDADED